jgi:L-threonylcarbamoyladenylate synthase
MINTSVIKVTEDSVSEIAYAAEIIKEGGLVVFPTETVYGLGADATNADAARKIYLAKGRPSDNPLIIHLSNPDEATKYTYTNDIYFALAKKFMPGPLTVVLKARDTVPLATRGGLDTVAVRCPENPIARKLIALTGVPIAAPSANLSGSPSPTNAVHVIDDMYGRVDVILDGGDSEFGLESTIVKINEDGTLTLLRPGKITAEELAAVSPVSIASAVIKELGDGEVALSPGMKYKHYAPKAKLILLDGNVNSALKYIQENKKQSKTAIISYTEDMELYMTKLPDAYLYDFGKKSDFNTHAHKLFYILREADKAGYEIIFAPLPKPEGVGLALYNRMIRAAAHTIIKM